MNLCCYGEACVNAYIVIRIEIGKIEGLITKTKVNPGIVAAHHLLPCGQNHILHGYEN